MKSTSLTTRMLVAVGAVGLLAITMTLLNAQAPGGGSGRGGGGRGAGMGGAVFTAVDANGDGTVTRDELKKSFDAWYATCGYQRRPGRSHSTSWWLTSLP